MAPTKKSRFWRICRTGFRRFRITVWLVLLAALGALLYLDQVGLPGVIKKPLLEKLHARGIDLQFSRLRWSWFRGIVAENVRFERANEPLSPQLALDEVRVQLNQRALARLQLQVDSLLLIRGRLLWPILETNQTPRQLAVTNIQSELRFLPNDQWTLDKFRAGFAGVTFQLSGSVSNASAIREWEFIQKSSAGPRTPADVWQHRLRRFADTLERIHFSSPPDLRLDLRGDARELQTFSLRMTITAPAADTPWGSFSQGRLTARLFPATNEQSRVQVTLDAESAQTRWGTTTGLHFTTDLVTHENHTNLVSGNLSLAASHVQTEWAGATNAQFTARWVHALTNPIPLSGEGQFRCEGAASKWASAGTVECSGQLTTLPAGAPGPDASWAWWTNLHPYILHWNGRATEVASPKLAAAEIECGGAWSSPELSLTNLHARLYQGKVDAQAHLNVATRALSANLASDFDPHGIAPLLGEGAHRWLARYSWPEPPRVQGEVALTLPAWTNRQPDWRGEVLPTLQLQGEFQLPKGGSYSNVVVSAAQSHVVYSNMVWQLPDLLATRPEGRLQAAHRADDRTKDFSWRLASTFDPRILRPLLDAKQQRAFDLFTLTQPPDLDIEIQGRFHDPESIGLKGRVALTNFTFRGQSFGAVQARCQYTNKLLQVFDPRVQRGQEQASADGLAADFNAELVYLTNGVSTMDPMVIARAIGPHVGRTVEPYRFFQPPRARVFGTIPMHGEDAADLYFDLEGGPFRWSRFNVPQIAGRVHWFGQRLTLENMHMNFYGGQASGQARFQFHPGRGADFQFDATTIDSDLHLLMADLSDHTNHLEGRLSGNLSITNANTEALQHVFGYGEANLRDGLLWDIPLFGVFSPMLNEFSPGLGNSRATAASCTFAITNSVILTDNLEIRAPPLRLQYRGTVDFDQRVNARAEAEMLRDMWLVGPLVSTVLWPVQKLFEFKVSGTLDEPKKEPVWLIPKLVFMPFQLPFHPIRTLKGLLPEDANASRTNAPPSAAR